MRFFKNKLNIKQTLSNERVFLRIIVYLIGVFLISIGILMIVNAGVGLSGPDAYLTSICKIFNKDPKSEWYGYFIWIHFSILWIIIVILFSLKKLLRKIKFEKKDYFYLLSILTPVFLTGPFVSLNSLWLKNLLSHYEQIALRYLIFIFGFLTAGFGGACTVWTKMFIEPHSGMVVEIQDILENKIKWIRFSYLRILLDLLFFTMAIVIGFLSNQKVFDFNLSSININSYPLISYSTIIFVLLNGFVFGSSIKLLKKIFGEPIKSKILTILTKEL